jgi:large subunit ribosomal protein L1
MMSEGKKYYSPEEGFKLVVESASAKFVESVDVDIMTNTDATNSVRGLAHLPCGTGKKVKIAVFAEGDDAKQAKSAGADIVGLDDMISEVSSGRIDFDVCLCVPSVLPRLTKIAKVLGPRGLMPSVKSGTVSEDIAQCVKNFKGGQVQFRSDKFGVVHAKLGNVSFPAENLVKNLSALLSVIIQLKPSDFKKQYIKSVHVSSTMGRSYGLDYSNLLR